MGAVYSVLGQSAPSAASLTTLYTATEATVVSSISIANRSNSTTDTYRIAVRPAGASIANQHYVAYDVPLAKNSTAVLTIGITCAVSDVISVYSTNGTLSFNLFGAEIEL
jgi:hypothetical protein